MQKTPKPRLLNRRRAPGGSHRLTPSELLVTLLAGTLLAGSLVLTAVDVKRSGKGTRAAAVRQASRLPRRAASLAPVALAKPKARKQQRVGRAPRPVGIAIPAIGVNAPVIPLGIDRTGALEVPHDFADAGWWAGGARPGEPGPAVIAGHVDSFTGPAVFFRLRELQRGDPIVIERADGSRVRFRVERSAHYPKARFPTAEVYGPTRAPALRVITCSGTFDRASGHYLDNTVVYAGR